MSRIRLGLFLSGCQALAVAAASAGMENLALHRPCEFGLQPNYQYCTDEDDHRQLTDGVYISGERMWLQRGAVGWRQLDGMAHIRPPSVTIDLGSDVPICGFSWDTAFGAAGVGFPSSIDVYVSNDGASWHYVGDLLSNALRHRIMPPPGVYSTYRAWTDDMPCHGRYVRMIPVQDGFCFVDEIEVYRGPDELLACRMPGEATADPLRFHRTLKLRNRLLADAERVGAGDEVRRLISDVFFESIPKGFRTIVPLNDVHRAIFAENARRLRTAGWTKPAFWRNCRWENLHPCDLPGGRPSDVIPPVLQLMRGEVRAETVNIVNPTDGELSCDLRIEGFGGDTPVECFEVVYADTKMHRCVASALKPGKGSGVRFSIPAGCSRQVWVSVAKPSGKAGLRKGTVKARLSTGEELSLPFDVYVHDLDYDVGLSPVSGGWDYLDSKGAYFCTPNCFPQTLALHHALGIDVAWGTKSVMPVPRGFGEDGEVMRPMDFTRFDEWVSSVHGMRVYAVFMAVGDGFHGEKEGSGRFCRMVTSYFAAWGEHLKELGFDGRERRLLVLLVDEPTKPEQAEKVLRWARPIRSARRAEIGVLEDPQFPDVKAVNPDFWTFCDVLSPLRSQAMNPGKVGFYKEFAAKGKEIWLYEANGPSRTFDPIAYYRAQAWAAYFIGSKASGTQFWAYGCGGRIGNSWTAYEQTGAEYSPYYVSPEGPMDAKQAEGVREGVEDYVYLKMYEAQFGRTSTENVVRKVLEAIPCEDPDWDVNGRSHALLDAVRTEMLRRLSARKGSKYVLRQGGK